MELTEELIIGNDLTYELKLFETIRSFVESTFNVKITLKEADKQSNLLNNIIDQKLKLTKYKK